MSEIYKPSKNSSARAWIKSMEQYQKMYDRSINDSDSFWTEEAEKFIWFNKWKKIRDFNYDVRNGKIFIEWFKGAKTNITVNCIDRHLETKGNQTAIIWEGNEPNENLNLTYKELHNEVCKFANVLKKHRVKNKRGKIRSKKRQMKNKGPEIYLKKNVK